MNVQARRLVQRPDAQRAAHVHLGCRAVRLQLANLHPPGSLEILGLNISAQRQLARWIFRRSIHREQRRDGQVVGCTCPVNVHLAHTRGVESIAAIARIGQAVEQGRQPYLVYLGANVHGGPVRKLRRIVRSGVVQKADDRGHHAALLRPRDQIGQQNFIRGNVQPGGCVHPVNAEVLNFVTAIDHLCVPVHGKLACSASMTGNRKVDSATLESVGQAQERQFRQRNRSGCIQLPLRVGKVQQISRGFQLRLAGGEG